MSRPHPFATRGGLRTVRPKQPTPQPPEPLPVLPGTEQEACERLISRLTQMHFHAPMHGREENLLLLELAGAYARQDALPGACGPPLEPHPRLAEARQLRTTDAT